MQLQLKIFLYWCTTTFSVFLKNLAYDHKKMYKFFSQLNQKVKDIWLKKKILNKYNYKQEGKR